MVRWSIAAIALPVAGAAQQPPAWQQEVRYAIHARLDETIATLAGDETIVYRNHAPDTLEAFYLHLYLNAFRPGSRWAARDEAEGRNRFQRLRDPDYGFERIHEATVDGHAVVPTFPHAPDSTVARLALPTALAPGDSIVVRIAWTARPSVPPRRQGRQGRRYDFAQWYPRVAPYDHSGWAAHPLYPAGEFYGEFATYDVTLDVAADQVIGATGIPLTGDPGWEAAHADPRGSVTHQRDWYGARPDAPPVPCRADQGRKCVRFYAEDVHHFAWSVNPDYVYEEGRFRDVVVRVLYLPEDRASWGGGIALRRTVEALRWFDTIFGSYPWPQLTNLHRIEGGGTEFPMVIMDGSASFGLILHETAHQYVMGILANNEWRHGFLDEGLASFLTAWYAEHHTPGFDAHAGLERRILDLDLRGWSEPIDQPGEAFRDFATYGAMTYGKAQLMYHQLRYVVGPDTMRAILREYYARWRLRHVTPESFQRVAEDVSGRDLDWFFDDAWRANPRYDYALGAVRREQRRDGTWETTVEIRRKGAGRMPVEIGSRDGTMIYARAPGLARVDTVRFRTATRPPRVMLDPHVRSRDWNFTNNRETGFFDFGASRMRFDTFLWDPAERDRAVESVAPTVWTHDGTDATVGVRVRANYLGRYDRRMFWLGRGVGGDVQTTDGLFDWAFSWDNPLWLRSDRMSQGIAAWVREGTVGTRIELGWDRRASLADERGRFDRLALQWIATDNDAFLDRARWDNAGTVELIVGTTSPHRTWGFPWTLRATATAGLVYRRPRRRTLGPDPFVRLTLTAAGRDTVAGFVIGLRAYAGEYAARDAPVAQRAIPLAGADPYETLTNPFLRTRGALLVRDDVFYHAPGHGNLRGFRPDLAGRWALTGSLEIERPLFTRSTGVFRSAGLVAFGDAGVVDTLAVPSFTTAAASPVSDAGVGVRLHWTIGDVAFPLRVEFPFFVSEPRLAHETLPGNDRVAFRWLISLQPSF